jgi:hypothetical protein
MQVTHCIEAPIWSPVTPTEARKTKIQMVIFEQKYRVSRWWLKHRGPMLEPFVKKS